MNTTITNHKTVVLDLRTTQPNERRFRVFDVFDNLRIGDTLKVVYSHDLQPLYYRLLAERRGEFVWQSEEESPEEWAAWIKKVR
ncbi:MAG: DUF2249 protein [Dehalococcoidia bacterium]|nr:DUF2249 protein [Dehalococcoidia bacterium]MBF8303864.1 hypothetical protein [Dehalococcoidia bacterium]